MNLKIFAGVASGAFLTAAVSAGAVVPLTPVTSFEGSVIALGDYGYSADETGKGFNPQVVTLTGVTFHGMSGLQANSPPWGYSPAPDGVTTAFLQSYSGETNGSIDVSLLGAALVAGRSYDLVFYAAGRPGYGAPKFTVTYGGKTTTFDAPSAGGFTKEAFSFTADGTQSVTFAALDGKTGDTAFALDNIGVAVPEPAAWAMMLIGFGGLGAALRMNRRRGPALA